MTGSRQRDSRRGGKGRCRPSRDDEEDHSGVSGPCKPDGLLNPPLSASVSEIGDVHLI